ncbi:MAG: hypothetical protein DRI69_09640 [Bacteroidetes bacterium]|nr:MAG: hypothetical protein DRI69_09640 [Bacteroidota bacterium]
MMANAINRLGETVQIWGSSSSTDALGNPVKAWDQDKGTCQGVIMRPTANDALFAAGKVSDTDKKIHLLPDASVTTGDRIEVDSVMYDLYGSLADWKMKQGDTVQFLQIFLKRVQ